MCGFTRVVPKCDRLKGVYYEWSAGFVFSSLSDC